MFLIDYADYFLTYGNIKMAMTGNLYVNITLQSKYLHICNLWNLFLVIYIYIYIYKRNLYMISTSATIHVSKYYGKIFKFHTFIYITILLLRAFRNLKLAIIFKNIL